MDVAVPLALAAVELLHPTWPGTSPSQAVAAAGAWWLIIHLALIVGYALLVLTLWHASSRPGPRPRTDLAIRALGKVCWTKFGRLRLGAKRGLSAELLGRVALAAFFASNTAFLAVDGLGVGLLARTEPASADALWNSPLVVALADATGATWSAALLILAARHTAPSRLVAIALGTVWIALIASPFVPVASLGSFAIALAVAAYQVYRGGTAGLPFALLAIAAILRQHVGAEAAVGMLCIALARVNVVRGRSTPAASSQP
jgi:hypothetical protein